MAPLTILTRDFTRAGTPFIDNYPTFAYIRKQRQDTIPDMIDRSFYAYTSDRLPVWSR